MAEYLIEAVEENGRVYRTYRFDSKVATKLCNDLRRTGKYNYVESYNLKLNHTMSWYKGLKNEIAKIIDRREEKNCQNSGEVRD